MQVQRKEPARSWGLAELEDSLAVTRRLEGWGASEGHYRKKKKNFFAAVRREQQTVMFFDDVRDMRK